ncbi:MAG: hypothetical protein JSS38_00620 [Nitrospira sp.]|nr:hypothetical protein [Nitrospira sp.]
MRYFGDDDVTQMKGIGLYLGDDGNLYEWVEGVDASEEAISSWDGLSKSEDADLKGFGALYQAPDGTMYQIQGLAEEEGAAEEAGTQAEAVPEEAEQSESAVQDEPPKAGRPRVQARRRFIQRRPGRPGFAVRRAAPQSRRRKGGFFKKLLPIAKFATRFIPGIGPVASAGLDVAGKLLKRKGVSGYDGLGYLYEAPDGSLYRLQGLAEEDLRGFAENEELKGFSADDELRGLDEGELRGATEDQELRGLNEDEELRGFAEDEELRGIGEDQDMRGIEGYVRQDDMSGLDAYVPQASPQTPWHVVSPTPPEIWKPLW